MTPAAKNAGKPCPYRKRTCDGLCNNCGLNATTSKTQTFAQAREPIRQGYGDHYENRILSRQEIE